jgi:hypothetical protein
MGRSVTLATSYFRATYRSTIIGAAAFHFRVRNGNGWDHRARITRRLANLKLYLGSRGRRRGAQASKHSLKRNLKFTRLLGTALFSMAASEALLTSLFNFKEQRPFG